MHAPLLLLGLPSVAPPHSLFPPSPYFCFLVHFKSPLLASPSTSPRCSAPLSEGAHSLTTLVSDTRDAHVSGAGEAQQRREGQPGETSEKGRSSYARSPRLSYALTAQPLRFCTSLLAAAQQPPSSALNDDHCDHLPRSLI